MILNTLSRKIKAFVIFLKVEKLVLGSRYRSWLRRNRPTVAGRNTTGQTVPGSSGRNKPATSQWANSQRASGKSPEKQNQYTDRNRRASFDARQRAAQSARERKERETEAKMRILQEKYSNLISAFYEVAERKVSLRDDYGQEQWDALDKEIGRVLSKIGTAEGQKDILRWKKYDFLMPEEYKGLSTFLAGSFKERHKRKRAQNLRAVDCSSMSGVEFEGHVGRILGQLGFTDIRSTPATNDQGADLLAKKDGRTIVIQTKRYSCPVGNSAVQEVISALRFYSGDEGWVVTNSTFTPSAKQLAQRAGIRLIDGHEFVGLST